MTRLASGALPLSPTEASFLQRLVADRRERRRMSQSALWFVEHYGLGVPFARHVEYQARHFDQARELLELHGLPLEALGPRASRADSAKFTGQSEKTRSRAPWADSVAVKPIGSAGGPWDARGAFLVLTVDEAVQMPCERLLVVENLETFRYLQDYKWLVSMEVFRARSVLALYRGDSTTSAADSAHVLRRRTEPVCAFTDFDPAGLGIAAALPRLERLLLPGTEWLKRAARGARSLELYERSRAQYEAVLEVAAHADIREAWTLMKSLRAGVSQESMRDALP